MKNSILSFTILSSLVFCTIPISAQKNDARRSSKNTPPLQQVTSETGKRTASANIESKGVYLKWSDNDGEPSAGYQIYRQTGKQLVLISEAMILGEALKGELQHNKGAIHTFFDRDGAAGSQYRIDFYNVDGKVVESKTVVPRSEPSPDGEGSRALARPVTIKRTGDVTFPEAVLNEINANTLPDDPVNHAWVISQPGVKIGVAEEGMQQVSRAVLASVGFDVNTPAANWRLFNRGVEQAIIVPSDGSYLEFYGKGVETQETLQEVYYLIGGTTPGKRIQNLSAGTFGPPTTAKNFQQNFKYKERTNYLDNILNGPEENFFGRVLSSVATTVPFVVRGIDQTQPEVNLTIKVQGFTNVVHSTSVELNGNVLSPVTGVGLNLMTGNYTVPTSFLIEGSNSLKLRTTAAANDFSLFESVSVDLKRSYTAEGDRLTFFTEAGDSTNLGGFLNPNFSVFDITNADEPKMLVDFPRFSGDTHGGSLPPRNAKYFAVNNTAKIFPPFLQVNDPSSLKSAANQGELIIISHNSWTDRSEEWADHRRSQGFSVKVVEVTDIFDDFSYGQRSAAAVREFLQYAKTNWQTPPNYVLLMGDGSFDPNYYLQVNGATPIPFTALVPTQMVQTIFSETGSDESLADFDGDGLAEIPIGRIPVTNPSQVSAALQNVINFETAQNQSLSRGAVFAYDRNDGYDFDAMSVRLRNQLSQTVPATMIFRDQAGAQSTLVSALSNGPYIVNYSGHGTTGVWGGADFFTVNQVSSLTNSNNRSLFTLLTCLNGYFVNVYNKSLSERLFESSNGGAAAVWASTGLTTPDVQEIMAMRFYQKLNEGQITRLGDLIRDAKSAIPFGADVRLSWALIGDPMLKVR